MFFIFLEKFGNDLNISDSCSNKRGVCFKVMKKKAKKSVKRSTSKKSTRKKARRR